MKKKYLIFILLVLFNQIYSQSKRLEVFKEQTFSSISTTKLNFLAVTVTPDEYILEMSIGKGIYTDRTVYITEITVGDLIPVKVSGLVLGKKYRTDKTHYFTVYVPRKWSSVKFTGFGRFGKNETIGGLHKYGNYVDKREDRKGFSDSEKPKVDLHSPKLTDNMYRTEELYVTLEGRVTDNLGVLSFQINGDKVKLSGDGSYKKRIKLKLGTNSVLLKATDLNNNSQAYEVMFIRDEIIEDTNFSDVDFPIPTSNQNSNAIAVVFGIEDYRSAPNVSYAVNDADIFREYLIKRFGFRRENIYLRLDEQATKGEFDKVFSKTGWISRNVSKSSDVIIYFSGHGAPDYESKETFLIPYDSDPNYATSTGYAINDIYKNLRDLDAKSITIILDACFSGSSRDNQPLLSDARPISIEIERGSIPENMLVFSAASGSEISSSSEKKKHGIFTYYLLKGLNGDADINSDHRITATEMNKYLNSHVPSQAKTMGREQHPQLLGSDVSRVVLSY